MKITCITGSPNKNGTSSLLAYHFIQGAIDKVIKFLDLIQHLKMFILALVV